MERYLSKELTDLGILVEYLENSKPLTLEEEESLNKPYREEVYKRMINTSETYGEATGSHGLVSSTKNQAEFKSQLKNIDNNLVEQTRIVGDGIRHYFKSGEIPPPYYAWRIAVILRKRKEYELEARFCEGFSKHFDRGVGGRYSKISSRVEKAWLLSKK